jgi:glutaredoxin
MRDIGRRKPQLSERNPRLARKTLRKAAHWDTESVPVQDNTEDSAGRHAVTLVTRQGCHLCEVAEAALARLATELGFSLELIDVDSSRALANEYSDRVPVILIDGAEHGYWQLEEQRFRKALAQPPKPAPNP